MTAFFSGTVLGVVLWCGYDNSDIIPSMRVFHYFRILLIGHRLIYLLAHIHMHIYGLCACSMQNQHLFNRRSTVRTERFVENGGLLLKGIRFCI